MVYASRSDDGFICKKKHPIILLDQNEYELIFLNQRKNMDLLTDADYEEVANELGCESKALKAVGIKETKDQSFYTHLGDHVPKILFERHYFHKLTNGKYDDDPDISNKSSFTKYGSYAKQYERLIKAYALSPREALMSASWGKFQVMGANMHSDKLSIEDILYKISHSEKNHLITLKGYLLKNKNALEALKSKKWDSFALYYNGSGYKKNNYDVLIKEIYEKL
ncbi:N-acetylmuramidase domain-containing protein [Gilliamella sp. App6-5]|uniref:N-acetylmuramidase domain-containing protein n=2 Tax=unclassified Gilliamella TaxID=2685620 RepID=UPI0009BD9BB3|nr:N-acetylmuramidase domain-containing protein [Gilliamella apicola]